MTTWLASAPAISSPLVSRTPWMCGLPAAADGQHDQSANGVLDQGLVDP